MPLLFFGYEIITLSGPERNAMPLRQPVNDHESRIVAGGGVAFAGISQTGD
jgi:hypothetical protein